MKVSEFGSIAMVNGELKIKDFTFDTEGEKPPYSPKDMLKAIGYYLENSVEEIVTTDGNIGNK